jgi:hypothetical protein
VQICQRLWDYGADKRQTLTNHARVSISLAGRLSIHLEEVEEELWAPSRPFQLVSFIWSFESLVFVSRYVRTNRFFKSWSDGSVLSSQSMMTQGCGTLGTLPRCLLVFGWRKWPLFVGMAICLSSLRHAFFTSCLSGWIASGKSAQYPDSWATPTLNVARLHICTSGCLLQTNDY